MARLPRVYVENVLYYVTSRGGHNQNIFIQPDDYREYVSLINRYKEQYSFKLFGYILLPSHLHMLIELQNQIGISSIMHDINSIYTKLFNGKYNKKGHLFQERFKAKLAEKESSLLPLLRHIHLNPKRVDFTNYIKTYPFSSYPQFLNPEKRHFPELGSEIEEVFTLLKGREKTFERYTEFVTQIEIDEFKKKLHKGRILGPREFTEEIKKRIESAAQEQKKAPVPKKSFLIYMISSGITFLVLVFVILYFYRQHTVMKSEYNKTMALYNKTLDVLRSERDKAIEANKEIDDYVWKIRLTEDALKELEKAKMEIEGYTWRIDLRQVGGPGIAFNAQDTIIFKYNRLTSLNLSREGFSDANYSKRKLKDDTITWETMQTNELGESASWHGKWDGEVLKGVLTKRSADGAVRDFTFVSKGDRMKK
ncbi:MAG: transposase [Candidatus Omnitrophica bacterium]|nr:transposase [Candidatus Omnitrophota bacterium]MBU1852712.1 transposase [Candidatus Omnitrophota bacterium]